MLALICGLQAAMPSPSFSRASAIQSLRTQENMEELRSNLKEEHILKVCPAPTSPLQHCMQHVLSDRIDLI